MGMLACLPACQQRFGDNIQCRFTRQAMQKLGHEADFGMAQRQHAVFCSACQVNHMTSRVAVEQTPRRRQIRAIDALEYRRLASSGGADQGAQFAGKDLQINVCA